LLSLFLIFVVTRIVTIGQSVIDAVNTLMEEGLSPIGIISVIEREDERKLKVLKNGTLKFDSLFKHSEFEDFIRKKKEQQKIK
jgi:orotate phosphoribosyltransferase